MTKTILALITLWAAFAPLPPGIAVNHATRECGSYQGGDEYATYRLPTEWEIYYPDHGSVQTSHGTCNWQGDAQSCCLELGYTFIPGNVGGERGHRQISSIAWALLFFQVFPVILLIAFISAVVFFIQQIRARPGNGESGETGS